MLHINNARYNELDKEPLIRKKAQDYLIETLRNQSIGTIFK